MVKSKLQQKRSQLTRRALIDAAEELWRDDSFDTVPVEEICRAANVAKGTFYFYFPRKENLLVMLVFSRFMPSQTELQPLLDSDASTLNILFSLTSGIASRVRKLPRPMVLRAVEESFQLYKDVAELDGRSLYLRPYFQQVFERGRKRGELHSDWDIDIVTGMVGWGILQELFLWGGGQTPTARLESNLLQRVELVASGANAARKTSRDNAPRKGTSKNASARSPQPAALATRN